jgi:hypothetical protein
LRADVTKLTLLGVENRSTGVDGAHLRDGAEAVVRVVSAPAGGGRGLISLAGRLLEAQLPAGLAAGQRLAVAVDAQSHGRVVLRILRQAAEVGPEPAARLAGELVLSGDPDLLRAALALTAASGAVPLPGGGEASAAVDPDEDGDARDAEAPARASVTLHLPALGPVEIGLALTAAGISATVITEPGRPAELARTRQGELAAALEHATGRPAVVCLAARGPLDARPAPLLPNGLVDVQA